ncbi:Zn-finger protein [Scheffersomyces stipitis CBS 6054]|uniref:Zn-finger protein n=1 Tax=Scheffersomyces stipitis (strain ATCC 58785 / CBS 6054 / NBRC 10063 / NRRL Y-11545) TaxID=322104 RepID=A3GHJ1_PICST|nr:Zn-finger protein [Scheffersomyces stipitis CBS 6054]EAZ63063.2 Zn-finger protein [Scheffersomyces stipitis CBS 6054]
MSNQTSFTTGRSIADPNYAQVALFDSHSKPREERDFKEIYPDLDEGIQLNMFVLNNDAEDDNDIDMVNPGPVIMSELKQPVFNKIDDGAGDANRLNVKFSKSITAYGFQEQNRVISKTIQDTYIRPFQLPGSNENGSDDVSIIGRILERKRNAVEYDMDEQDCLFLSYRNQQPNNVIKITPEVFEIMITTLENEWDKLEHQMNSIINNNGSSERAYDGSTTFLSLDRDDIEKYGTDDGIIPGSIYDQRCAVCNDSDCDNSNAIVFCDGCDIAVHQECYGIAFIPEGQWLCRKCMINKNRKTDCVFCPSKTGAFKQLDNSLWSHVICALWINELYFANPIYMEPIEGIDLIPKSRWKLVCYICKQRIGACIQCTNRNCFQAYHVTCARRAGLYMEMTMGMQGAISNKMTLRTFCDKHSPPSWNAEDIPRGIQRTRLFYRDTNILNERNAKLSSYQKTANKLNIFKWKTENNTPIAPKVFSDVLFNILQALKVENQVSLEENNQLKDLNVLPNRSREDIWADMRSISNEICRYWCLKRESKKGAPLIRKNNNFVSTSSILYNANGSDTRSDGDYYEQIDEIKGRIDFAEVLVRDLDKVIDMNKDSLSRQVYSREVHNLEFESIDAVYFPIKKVIENCLNTLNEKFDANRIIQGYQVKVENENENRRKFGDLPVQISEQDNKNGEGVSDFLQRDFTDMLPRPLTLSQIISKNAKYGYFTIEEFNKDLQKFSEIVLQRSKSSNNIHRLMKRWMKEYYKILPEMFSFENKVKRELNNNEKILTSNYFSSPSLGVHGSEIMFKSYDVKELLDENDLSEVENDMNDANQHELHRFLNG